MTYPTLPEFFDQKFMKAWTRSRDLDEKTKKSYRESIKLWIKLTQNVPIDQITSDVIGDFLDALKLHPGKQRGSTMKPRSRAKHARQLDCVLKTAGPQTRHNKRGTDVLSKEPPFFDIPAVPQNCPDKDWTIEEIRQLYAACHVMKHPQVAGVSPPDWWRALIVIGYYTGLRIYALTHVRYEDLNGQWLIVPDEISKGDKGITKWMPTLAMEHVELIRTPDRSEILHVPEFERRKRFLYDWMKLLLAEAKIAPERWWKFHSLRATYGTMLGNNSAEHDEDIRTAQLGLGHSDRATSLGHYLNSKKELQRVAEATEKMPRPVPPEFLAKVQVVLPTPTPTVELPPKPVVSDRRSASAVIADLYGRR